MQQIEIDVVKMYPDVILPEYKTDGSAGCDVRAYLREKDFACDSRVIFHGEHGIMIPTGLKVKIPSGYYMAVVPRSGIAVKTTMRIANQPGTVDCDYLGEIKIIVDNNGDDVVINHQDRIAQFIFLPYYQAKFKIVDKLEETVRGEGGMGSTGTK